MAIQKNFNAIGERAWSVMTSAQTLHATANRAAAGHAGVQDIETARGKLADALKDFDRAMAANTRIDDGH